MSTPIRVLVVDDSAIAREYLTTHIQKDPNLIVAGQASNGKQAVEMTCRIKPDILSMDINMPGMNGLVAIQEILGLCPTPIIVASDLLDREVNLAFDALQAGALAVVRKLPSQIHPGFAHAHKEYLQTLREMSTVTVLHRWVSRPALKPRTIGMVEPTLNGQSGNVGVIGIAASTGGPAALAHIISQLPVDFPVPVLIVQHISESFEDGLVRWLNTVSSLKVCVAQRGHPLEPGQVLLAPPGFHLKIAKSRHVMLDSHSHGDIHVPVADVLFHSLAETYGKSAMGIILTGMGNDGAEGLQAIYQAGGITLAQDQETSVVFGMPAEAIKKGAVSHILSLHQIPDMLIHIASNKRQMK